jgi:hypothetical protein
MLWFAAAALPQADDRPVFTSSPHAQAFTEILEDMNVTEKELLSNPEALTALLLYHVSQQLVPDLGSIKTLPVGLLNKSMNITK